MGSKLISILLLSAIYRSSQSTESLGYTVNPKKVNSFLDKHFISLLINPSDLLQGRPFGLGINSTLGILQGLSPGYIRLGGPSTKQYVFRPNNAVSTSYDNNEIIISESHWKNLNDFMKEAGMDLIVCLNDHLKDDESKKWDPRNALELISVSDREQFNLTWQLGFEPIQSEDNNDDYENDLIRVRAILNAFPRYGKAKLIGPDIHGLHHKEQADQIQNVLIDAGSILDAITWHPRWPQVTSMTPSDSSDEGYNFPPDFLEWDHAQLQKLFSKTLTKKPIWISETKHDNSGTFAEGLIWARRLILAAKLGIDVVMKQPSLTDISHPKPEYWISLLHKKLLARSVLDSRPITNQSDVFMSVHCTSNIYNQTTDGGATIFMVNIGRTSQKIQIRGVGMPSDEYHQFIVTSGSDLDSIFSQMTYLNGEPLLITEDGMVPEIKPKVRHIKGQFTVKLPSYSIGFWVLPYAKIKVCQQEPPIVPPINIDSLSPSNVIKTNLKGLHTLQNMNEIFVNKLLNPISNEETSNEESIVKKRVPRAQPMGIDQMAKELGESIHEMEAMLNQKARSAGVEINTPINKIDSLANHMNAAIEQNNQQEEFNKFLHLSGLNRMSFGDMMMSHRKIRSIPEKFDPKERFQAIRNFLLQNTHAIKNKQVKLKETLVTSTTQPPNTEKNEQTTNGTNETKRKQILDHMTTIINEKNETNNVDTGLSSEEMLDPFERLMKRKPRTSTPEEKEKLKEILIKKLEELSEEEEEEKEHDKQKRDIENPSESVEEFRKNLIKKKMEEKEEFLNMAEMGLRKVLNDLIPKVFNHGQEKIQDIDFPHFLDDVKEILKKLNSFEEYIRDNSTGHVQKITRNKREVEDFTSVEVETTTTSPPDVEILSTTIPETTATKIPETTTTESSDIFTQIIKHFQPKSKREIPLVYFGQNRKREARFNNYNSLQSQPALKQLRPGVYVIPSKDMTNIRTLQTQNSEEHPNVVTLNIFYDKKKEGFDIVKTAPPVQQFQQQQQQQQFYQPQRRPDYSIVSEPPKLPSYSNSFSELGYPTRKQTPEPLNWKYYEDSKDSIEEKKEPEIEPPPQIKKPLREPFWNKTLRELFLQSPKEPFWDMFLKPDEQNENHQRTRRSADNFFEVEVTPYLRNRRHIENYIVKTNAIENGEDNRRTGLRNALLKNYENIEKRNDKSSNDLQFTDSLFKMYDILVNLMRVLKNLM